MGGLVFYFCDIQVQEICIINYKIFVCLHKNILRIQSILQNIIIVQSVTYIEYIIIWTAVHAIPNAFIFRILFIYYHSNLKIWKIYTKFRISKNKN